MKKTILLFFASLLTLTASAANVGINATHFPDPKFRDYLLNNNNPAQMNGYGLDGILTTEELANVWAIDVPGLGIADLTGIELFPNLQSLTCDNNQLTTLNVSGMTKLVQLFCRHNQLTSLNVTGCTALGYLECYDNQLTKLDVSGLTKLKYLACNQNQLSSLSLTSCAALETLTCQQNKLKSLTVSYSTALTYFDCSDNQLTSLNVSGLTQLTTLLLANNQLKTLNTSGCTALTKLDCKSQQLTSLNVKNCTALTDLDCQKNQLPMLMLTDLTALKTVYCQLNKLTTLNVEGCTAMETLNCSSNHQLTLLDVTTCTALKELNCADNALTSLSVAGLKKLQILRCQSNQLASLSVEGCSFLQFLSCHRNQIKGAAMDALVASLRSTGGTKEFRVVDLKSSMEKNEIYTNQVAAAKAKGWTVQDANGNEYEGKAQEGVEINEENFPDQNFRYWLFDQTYGEDGFLTNEELAAVTYMSVSGKGIDDLTGIRHFTALQTLFCYNNQLSELDVSGLSSLKYLRCQNNCLTSLDLSGCTSLIDVDISVNRLTGDAVDKIMADLPTVSEGTIVVFDESNEAEENEVTSAQVAVAKAKGWKVKAWTGTKYVDYEGCDVATAIDGLSPDPSPEGKGSFYSIDGKKLNGEPTAKGIYVVKGKKVKR